MSIDTCPTVTISAAGNLTINSTPTGARIWLVLHGGTFADKGVNTNTTLTVAAGSYDIKLVLAGYQDWVDTSGTITVTDGGTTTVNATLTPSTGSVTITSTPTGAAIYLDGSGTSSGTTSAGGTTISGLSPGTHSYILVLTGYADATGTFSITANTNTPLSVTFAGSAAITSTPSGASIYLDGSTTSSGITPLTITGLTSGVHSYKLTLAGYADITGTFTATAGTTVSVSQTFTGDLNIASTPSGAEIYIDNVDQVAVTVPGGTTITGVAVGSRDIRLTLAGYADRTITGVTISPGSTTTILATAATFAGSANITSTPPGARIWLAASPGTPVDLGTGKDTNLILTGLTAATSGASTLYNYKLTLAGYADITGTFTATAGTTVSVSQTFTGDLNIASTPSGAEIYIDNVDQVAVTVPGGTTITGVAVGSRDIRLTLAGYADRTITGVTISPGSTTTILATAATFAGSATITSTPSGAEIYIAAQPGVPTDQLVTTPRTITGLTAASPGATTTYNYKLTHAGYADATGTFAATAGSTIGVPVTMLTPPNITATNITVTPSETPCMTGTCTVTVVVRWSNSGQTDGTVIPNIKIDGVSQAPHASRIVPAGGYIDETFGVTGLSAAAHTICPDPN